LRRQIEKLSAEAKLTQARYGTSSQAAVGLTGWKRTIVARIEAKTMTISINAKSGRRSPKKIGVQAALRVSWNP
jgi:hypothetical protein